MTIKVKVPNQSFDGFRGGVKFEQGVGIFEDEALGRATAAEFGYEVIEDAKPKEAPKADEASETESKRPRRKKDEA